MSELSLKLATGHGDFSLDVDLRLPAHGISVLFGHSGSGKSTLLRAIAGLNRCRGSVQFGDVSWQSDRLALFRATEQRPIGYVFQEASLFPHLSVRDNLAFGQKYRKQRVDADEVIHWLGLEPLLDRDPATLSGGERQRVAIGRALLAGPELLLMDEPLAALDHKARREIMPYLQQLHRRLSIPVIYVTHALDEVVQLADYMVQIEAGRIIAKGLAIALLASLAMWPVAGEEPGAIIEAHITAHDETNHLSRLSLDGELSLLAPKLDAELGELVRIRVPAREVSISLEKPEASSILNVLPAGIIDYREGDPGRVLVQLELVGSGVRLLSRITHYSWMRLGLDIGHEVQAQIKSMGLAA